MMSLKNGPRESKLLKSSQTTLGSGKKISLLWVLVVYDRAYKSPHTPEGDKFPFFALLSDGF